MKTPALAPLLGLSIALVASSAVAQDPCDPKVPRALVLSGGGSKGAFEAGAMYHLIVHRGCDFIDIAGVSVGGLNASYVGEASTRDNSLINLQKRTRELVDAWREVPGPQQFLTKRFLGPVRMAVFGIESLYDFAPARRWIRQHIHPDAIQKSGRNVRIGTVNFYDGTYREITPGSGPLGRTPSKELLGKLDLYWDFVLGGALIPVFGEMPRIPENLAEDDPENWPQYADGGLRHQTPIPGYFYTRDIVPFLPPHRPRVPVHEPVQELMVVMSAPYDPQSDRSAPPRDSPVDQKRKHVRDGRKILERTVMDIVLDSPYRWDAGFGIVANRILEWRANLYEGAKKSLSAPEFAKFQETFQKLNEKFPVESTYSDPEVSSRPYRLGIVFPAQPLTDSYDFDRREILKQLKLGCLAANKMMTEEPFKAPPRPERCEQDPALSPDGNLRPAEANDDKR